MDDLVSDDDLQQATVAELEALEFRVYAELRNREEDTLSEMTFADEHDVGYDAEGPF